MCLCCCLFCCSRRYCQIKAPTRVVVDGPDSLHGTFTEAEKNINWTALKRCSLQSEWTAKRRIAIMIQSRQDCVHQFFQDKHCTHCTSDQEIHLRQRICVRSRLKFQGSKAQVGKMALLIQHLHHNLLKSRNVSKTLSLSRTEHN